MKKKIAVVIPKYGLVGGGEKYAFEITERLARFEQYNIHVFANKWACHSKKITFHKVPLLRFPKFLTTCSFAYFANRKIARMGFDLIHSHDRIFHADIFTMHGIPHELWVKRVRKKNMSLFDQVTSWVEKSLVESGTCKKYLAVSTLSRQMFVEKYNAIVSEAQTAIIRPGVDIDRFNLKGNESIRNSVRERFGIHKTDKVVLFVSMNFELKGLDLLIEVLSTLKKQGQPTTIKLLVVGKGNQDKYTKKAQKMGVDDAIIFTGVWYDNIEHAYWASDVLAMFSAFDTFGMTVLEAMAASLPVMISDTVGAKDIVKQGINGYVFSSLDPDKIGNKLLSMLIPINSSALKQNARDTAKLNTWDAAADQMNSIYSSLLKQQPTTGVL